MQEPSELKSLIDLFKAEGVRSYLEIGSNWGGSLWRIANALPKGSRVLSVDMPYGDHPNVDHSLAECIRELNAAGYQAEHLSFDSTLQETVRMVAERAPFDACLIDGGHELATIRSDWENYGPMSRLVAFHDIAWSRPAGWKGSRIDVPEFWNAIKGGYRHVEFKASAKDCGIGVLWRC